MHFFDSLTTIKENKRPKVQNIKNPQSIKSFFKSQSNLKRPALTSISLSNSKKKKLDKDDNLLEKLENKKDSSVKEEKSKNDIDITDYGDVKHAVAFSKYISPREFDFEIPHPYEVVESTSLSTLKGPKITYKLNIKDQLVEKRVLSNVQLESVYYACQKHQVFLHDDKRAGFLIGDGPGVGKGRTVAGIIHENFSRNRKKAIWVSVSNDLKVDAERDLVDIGKEINSAIPIQSLNKMTYRKINGKDNGYFNEGVLFVTYSSLISVCRKKDEDFFKSRFDQIVDWFDKNYDGLIIFDECHKAKNVEKDNETKTGILVNKLQDELPNARIVYASATGASEPKHMGYMSRLGLWGQGTRFKNFEDFKFTLDNLGVGAMELIAIEIKSKGFYVSRQLDLSNVDYETKEAEIKHCKINGFDFQDVYARCVDFWGNLRKEFEKGLKTCPAKLYMRFWAQFWSSHQRFFKCICISAKIQKCVILVKEEIEKGNCVVIGLQSTGEARTMDELDKACGKLTEYISSAEGILKNLVYKFFPCQQNFDRLAKLNKAKILEISEKEIDNDNDIEEKSKMLQKKNYKRKSHYLEKEKDINLSDTSDEDEYKLMTNNRRISINQKSSNDIFNSESRKVITLSDEEETNMTRRCSARLKNKKIKRMYFENQNLDNISRTSIEEDYIEKTSENENSIVEELEDPNIQLWLDNIAAIKHMLPKNILDELIHLLGGPSQVAEMTGRKGRVIEEDNIIKYKSRKEDGICIDQINIKEKDRFNSGEKLIAIISDAASTGISLHSDVRFTNQRQRVHVTLELPWSADKAIQQFGRTNRSNQALPPRYIFLISDLAGERRFAATVAKRLESLGALTHGDRRCSDASDLSQFNLDSKIGERALKQMLVCIFGSKPSLVPYPIINENIPSYYFVSMASKSLEDIGISINTDLKVLRFLNRILGVEPDMQNALFKYFIAIKEELSNQAKLSNIFDHGIRNVENTNSIFKLKKTEYCNVNHTNSIDKIILNHVECFFQGVTYKSVLEKYIYDSTKNMFCETWEKDARIVAFAEFQNDGNYKILTPNFPEKLITSQVLQRSYKILQYELSKSIWEYIYKNSHSQCSHVIGDQNCLTKNCIFGKRKKTMYIVTGSVFNALQKLQFSEIKTKKFEIVRIQLSDKTKMIGALIPANRYQEMRPILLAAPKPLQNLNKKSMKHSEKTDLKRDNE